MDGYKVLEQIEELLEVIRGDGKIILYGYKDIGENLLDYLMHNFYQIRNSGYSGKVRCFATSFDSYEMREGRKEVKGLPVFLIEDLKQYSKTDLVLITAREADHEDMIRKLRECDFLRIACVSRRLYTKIKMVNRKISGQLRLEVMQYSLNHQAKLEQLRKKVSRGKKVRVLFMAHNTAVFGCKSVYEAMEKSDLFEPYILVFSKRDKIDAEYMRQVSEDYASFKSKGYRVLSAHDTDDYLVDLESYEPDILFIDYPNAFATASATHTRGDLLNWKYLTCYVPYGCLMANSFYYHYETMNTREVWKFFLDTKYSYKRCISEADFNGGNAVLSGYPKFDDYFEKKENAALPGKLLNGKKTVIYAPHWSIGISNNYATFDKYCYYFMQLVHENPEINFVFKPHPQLGYRLKTMEEHNLSGVMSYEAYQKYIEEWGSMPNGVYVGEGDYIDLFRESACLITDCGSFIGEYLLSGHPCIYLINPDKENPMEGYTEVAGKILDTYYLCENIDEIKDNFQRVVLDSIDEKSEERKALTQSEFYNLGNAGAFICDYLEQQIRG